VNVDARPPAFQLKSYSWSQRTRVGVLTNFRQLRVFETLTRPVYDDRRAGLLDGLELDYTQYAADWDRLWDLLSREAVHAGSIERAGRDRRGNLRVDEAFLEELTEWRKRIAVDLAERNIGLDRWALTEATQRILDRLIFLRVCEDRTVEQQVVLRRFARVTDAYQGLRTEFRRLDTIYNGALFAEHFLERLELSDSVLQRFIESLYFPYSPYRFDVIGAELLGGVYERFLGKEIDLDARRRVTLDDKPEVRHAGGVYYTPPWVVSEIVERTIGPLLAGKTPRTAEQLKIVDPSCGSGSFLLGVLDYLIRWHESMIRDISGVLDRLEEHAIHVPAPPVRNA
jgi:N-6 DNA Methylase